MAKILTAHAETHKASGVELAIGDATVEPVAYVATFTNSIDAVYRMMRGGTNAKCGVSLFDNEFEVPCGKCQECVW